MFNTTLPISETATPATSRIQTAKIQARNSTEQFAGYRVGRGVNAGQHPLSATGTAVPRHIDRQSIRQPRPRDDER